MFRRDKWKCYVFASALLLLATVVSTSATASFAVLEECPGSQVPLIRHRAQSLELSLVLYYTSWSEQSVRAREIYAEVAHYYYDQVHFAAVDCWHLACNCSRTTTTAWMGAPRQWPTLMVHYGRQLTLQYHGAWEFAALTRFLDTLFRPLQRLHNKAELRALSMSSDAVVLGLFAHASCREYEKFANAAVKWLETDPEQGFRFAVAFGATAESVLLSGRVAEMPMILLVSNRGVEAYNNSAAAASKWHVSQIVWWAQTELKRAFAHVQSYTTPSTLAAQAKIGPVLAVFANDWMDRSNDFYTAMENVMDPVVVDPIRKQFAYCELYWNNEDAKYAAFEMQQDYQQQQQLLLEKQRLAKTLCHRKEYLSQHNLQHFYAVNAYLNSLLTNHRSSAFYDELDDQNSADKLLELYQHNRCLRHPNYRPPELRIAIGKFVKKSTDRLWLNSLGPQQRNRTLAIAVLDSELHEDFLLSQGITQTHLSAAVAFIIDARQEQVFIMQEKFSYSALLEFAQSYYEGSPLTVHKAASLYRPPPPQPPTTTSNIPSAAHAVYLHELNRQMLLQALQQPQQNASTVVLLLYTPQCALSAIMSQTLLQLSALLSAAHDDIQFVRLNAQTNDLPWELVMHSTPALLVFPRDRYTESRVFPTHLKADVRNVFGFILAQLTPVEQVKLALGSCRRSILTPQRLQKCLQFAKQIVMQHIGHHLKIWQIFEQERHFVLERLKEFKDITLDIQRSFVL